MSCQSNIKGANIKGAKIASKGTGITMIVFVTLCALPGCSDIYFDRRETVVPTAGDAKQINQITMMVDPWPRHSDNRNIAFNGERMQGAVERYRTHNVIRPVSPLTSDSGSQSQPPPDYTTEQVRGTPQTSSRNGPSVQGGPTPSAWANQPRTNAAPAPAPSQTDP